jgi:hypothetical protein
LEIAGFERFGLVAAPEGLRRRLPHVVMVSAI